MRNLILVLTLGTIMTACQYDPYADKYTTVKPTDNDVIGIYEYKFQTVDETMDKEKIRKSGVNIIINPDKTYKINRLPYFKEIEIMTFKFDKQISLTGKWTIEEIG